MIKDKIHTPKEITDNSNVWSKKKSDLNQCPYCLHLFVKEHTCNGTWLSCTICGMDLNKKGKKVRMNNGQICTTMPTKKFYRIINSLICHQCACNIVKVMKNEIVLL